MSFLQEMGIQQWRLRGRKPVAKVNDEARLAIESAESQPLAPLLSATQLTESEHNVSALLKEIVPSQPMNDSLSAKKPPSLTPSEPTPAPQRHLPKKEITQGKPTNIVVEESFEPSISTVGEKSAPQSVTSGITAPSSVQEKTFVSDVEMPSLRPAPVPFELPVEMDLSIAEPETPELEHPVLDGENYNQAPDYNGAEVAPIDFGEKGGWSVFGTMPDEAVEYNEKLEPLPLDNLQNEPHNESTFAELSQLDWRALQARLSNDSACPSCGQQQSVLGFGNVLADWMFIADAPTTLELQAQQLFVGRAAQLFEGILSACGLRREQVYSSTIFKCSPPEDLSLSPQCDKLIHRQVELIQPKVIVTFGEFSSQAMLRANESFDQLSKGRHSYAGTSCLVIPSHSPQYLLANPALKAGLWQELKCAMQSIG